MRVREVARRETRDGRGGTTPWETGGMAGRLRDCLGSEREEATTSVLSPSVISREWASCMTNTAGWRVREGTPPRARRSRSREILSPTLDFANQNPMGPIGRAYHGPSSN